MQQNDPACDGAKNWNLWLSSIAKVLSKNTLFIYLI